MASTPVKINTVVERGVNDDEIVAMVEFARRNGYSIRFIEYMDVGNVNQWGLERWSRKMRSLPSSASRSRSKKRAGRAAAHRQSTIASVMEAPASGLSHP